MAQIIKRGPSYMVRVTWRDVDGKQHKKPRQITQGYNFLGGQNGVNHKTG